jgi:hypothetical protein
MDDFSELIDIIIDNLFTVIFLILIVPVLFIFFTVIKEIALPSSIDDIEFFEKLLIIALFGIPSFGIILYILKKIGGVN